MRGIIDWTAPACEIHDELVELFCGSHPKYNPEMDAFEAANKFADDAIARRIERRRM